MVDTNQLIADEGDSTMNEAQINTLLGCLSWMPLDQRPKMVVAMVEKYGALPEWAEPVVGALVAERVVEPNE